MSTRVILQQQAKREWLSVLRKPGDVFSPLVFFLIVATLFPIAIGTNPQLLRDIGPGVLWVALLLAAMLSLQRLFVGDLETGVLAQMLVTPCPLPLMILIKVTVHWLTTIGPMILLAPLLGIPYGLSADLFPALLSGMLLGSPVLYLIGAVNAALTVGVRGGGVLMALLVLPLYVPVLIFGSGAVASVELARDPAAQLYLLGALLALTLFLAPWGAAAALRISLD